MFENERHMFRLSVSLVAVLSGVLGGVIGALTWSTIGFFPLMTLSAPPSRSTIPLLLDQIQRDERVYDIVFHSCGDMLKDELKTVDKPDGVSFPLNIDVYDIGNLMYKIAIQGNGSYLSSRSKDYWERVDIFLSMQRDFINPNAPTLNAFTAKSQKAKAAPDMPPEGESWREMGEVDQPSLESFQTKVTSFFRTCVVKQVDSNHAYK